MSSLGLLKSEFPVLTGRRQITLKPATREAPEHRTLQSVPVVILLELGIKILIKPAIGAVATSMLGNRVMRLQAPVNVSTTHVAIIARPVALGTMVIP